MWDALMAWLESREVPSWVFLMLFSVALAYIVIRILRRRITLEIDDHACSTSVDFQAERVYRSIVYKVQYPEKLAFLSLWLYDLEFELPQAPQFIQVERVEYIHPGQDPIGDDEPTEFSKLGKLVVDSVIDAEGSSQRILRQIIPKAVARVALGRRKKVLWFYPICRVKGVDTVVVDIWYPREDLDELVEIEDDLLAEGILRFVIRKSEDIKKVYSYRLRYCLPQCIKSFGPHVEYNPLEARLPVRPQDLSVIATCSLDRFDRDTPTGSYELDWMFNIAHNAIEVRLPYNEA